MPVQWVFVLAPAAAATGSLLDRPIRVVGGRISASSEVGTTFPLELPPAAVVSTLAL